MKFVDHSDISQLSSRSKWDAPILTDTLLLLSVASDRSTPDVRPGSASFKCVRCCHRTGTPEYRCAGLFRFPFNNLLGKRKKQVDKTLIDTDIGDKWTMDNQIGSNNSYNAAIRLRRISPTVSSSSESPVENAIDNYTVRRSVSNCHDTTSDNTASPPVQRQSNSRGSFYHFVTANIDKYILGAFIVIIFIMMIAITTMASMLDISNRETSITMQTKTLSTQWVLCNPTFRPENRTGDMMIDQFDISRRHLCTTNDQISLMDTANVTYHFHNPLSGVTRYVCEERIPIEGKTNKTIPSSNCSLRQPPLSNIFATPPMEFNGHDEILTLSPQQNATPIHLQFGDGNDGYQLFEPCDIPCLYDGGPDGVVNDRYVTHLPDRSFWNLIFSMEGPQYYPNLIVDNSNHWQENQFYSTTSYRSDIPLPYYSHAEFDIWHNNYVPFDVGIKGGAFLARNCGSRNERELLLENMMEAAKTISEMSNTSHALRIDSLSDCLHNADPPSNLDLEDKNAIMKQYLFYFAFENQCEDDYITEKLWGPLEAGTIPVYYGAPNVKDHVPNRSVIHVDDFPTEMELVQHLIEVSQNRTLYESYHAWRTLPVPEHFRIKYGITDTHSTCRTCRWAYARIHGLGWNHITQSLRPLNRIGSRRLCLSKSTSEVEHPFIEEWVNHKGERVSVEPIYLKGDEGYVEFPIDTKCSQLHDKNAHIDIDRGTLQRTVHYHDGVADINIQWGTNFDPSPLRLRIKAPLLRHPVVVRQVREDDAWHFQDNVTRYTLAVASKGNETAVKYDSEGNFIYMDIAASIQIRILVEDVDTFHVGADQVETYFGRLMTDDFLHPIQMHTDIPIQ